VVWLVAMDRHLYALLLRLPPRVRPLVESSEPNFEKVLKKIREVLPVIREQQQEAENLVNKLLREHRPAQRQGAIRRSKKLQSWAVARALSLRSRETVYTDAKEAAKLGMLATEAALHVQVDVPAVGDLRALCLATTANAYRVMRCYQESSRYFGIAYQHLSREGTGDLYAQGEVFSLHASLLKDQKLYKEALTVLDQAVRLFGAEGDEQRLARCLIKRACTLRNAKDLQGTIKAYMDALHILDDHREPWLTAITINNLASVYCDCKQYKTAAATLRLLSPSVLSSPEVNKQSFLLQVKWTRALTKAGLGRRAEALKLFEQVEAGFTVLPDPVNAALAGLDTARLYHKARKYRRVEDYLRRVHRVLLHHHFPEQLQETIGMLVTAAQEQRLILEGIERAITALRAHKERRPC